MKIKKSQKNLKTKLYAVIVVVVLLLSLLAVYLYYFKGTIFGWSLYSAPKTASSINYDEPTDDQKKSGQNIKEVSTDTTKTDSSDTPTKPEPQSNGKSSVSLTITTADNQNRLRVLIGAVTNSGTCTLTLSKGTETRTYTVGVQALKGESTCMGFDFPSPLSAGTWLAVIHFENSVLQGDTKQDILIQ